MLIDGVLVMDVQPKLLLPWHTIVHHHHTWTRVLLTLGVTPPSQGATFHQLENHMVPTEREHPIGSAFILTVALFSILTLALFPPLGSPSLPVSSPHACSNPSLLACLPVFLKMKGLYKQNPVSARLNS